MGKFMSTLIAAAVGVVLGNVILDSFKEFKETRELDRIREETEALRAGAAELSGDLLDLERVMDGLEEKMKATEESVAQLKVPQKKKVKLVPPQA
jgi:hypothetical protein